MRLINSTKYKLNNNKNKLNSKKKNYLFQSISNITIIDSLFWFEYTSKLGNKNLVPFGYKDQMLISYAFKEVENQESHISVTEI